MRNATARAWVVLISCGLASGGFAGAQSPDPPPFYAIRDVTIVSGGGAPIEGATVLLADGLIEAVGPDLEIPADAWVIEGRKGPRCIPASWIR